MEHNTQYIFNSRVVKPSKKKGYIEGAQSHSGDDFWIEYKRIKINPQLLPKSIIHFGDIVE